MSESKATSDWKTVKKFAGSLGRVVAVFEFSFYPHMPDGSKIKIKVTEDVQGNFIASMNVKINSDEYNDQAGLGNTLEQALQNILTIFNDEVTSYIEKYGPLKVDDLQWADPQDF